MDLLLLWDIDGTLLSSGGAGMRALQAAFQKEFVPNGLLDDIEFGGRTDRWIMRRIFEKFGLEASEANFVRLTEAYLHNLPAAMASGPAHVLPGVRDLLMQASERPRVAQGLLTGNIKRGAAVKLGFHGLWETFHFGAFGDDSELRNELGPHALRRARERHGYEFPPGKVWIIGDTPHDIACARVIGANSLAVATGGHTAEVLARSEPTALLPDLSQPDAFWQALTQG
ncbi:MAG TPA: haloacid dehalogenase-like hydrolase [Opitutaceae bacterium]|nr:haloacid dehalogenase-like hydrolase [Opitutaceae bacterium]